MNTNHSYARQIRKSHERDTKYTGVSEDRELTFIHGNRTSIDKGTAHGMGRKWCLAKKYNRNHSRKENT